MTLAKDNPTPVDSPKLDRRCLLCGRGKTRPRCPCNSPLTTLKIKLLRNRLQIGQWPLSGNVLNLWSPAKHILKTQIMLSPTV